MTDNIMINLLKGEEKKENNEEIIVGIDLGTTNSCIAIWRNNNLEIIPDENGNKTIPSYVAFTNISKYIGYDARNQKNLNPGNVYYEVKRLIGRKFSDIEVQQNKKFLTYNIKGDENDNIILTSELKDNKCFTPEEISAKILLKLKEMAMNYTKQKIEKAVITIPAYFTDAQRQATKDAAEIAGLKCIRMINEPTAAALAYGMTDKALNKKLEGNDNPIRVLVYDFGGGTLDVSVLEISNDIDDDTKETRQVFQVLASAGNTHFGGADFDNRIVSYCLSKYATINKANINVSDFFSNLSALSVQKLRLNCETAKKVLSTNESTYIAVKDFYKEKDLFIKITRDNLELICKDYFLLSMKNIDDVLDSCNLNTSDIDEIIVVGGMTRMPMIRQLLEMKFGKKPNCSINPDETIAVGAAIQANILLGSDPFSKSITLLDITPLSLGVETIGGIMDVLIERGTIIPYETQRLYTTDSITEKSVIIKIYEGERLMTQDNIFIGEFILTNIPEKSRGLPEIMVTINIDINGIVTVTAEEQETHDMKSIIVNSNKGRLSRGEIEELIENAKDMEIRDEIEKRKKILFYEINNLCNNILININNEQLKLSDDDKKIINNDISIILLWLKDKKYYDRTDDDLNEIVVNIKKKYGVLILKKSIDNSIIDANINKNEQLQSTTIYGNDNDDIENDNIHCHIFEQIEINELGLNGMTENEKIELKNLRKNLFDLCYSIFEILDNDTLIIYDIHKSQLKDFINDSLLWLHIHDKPSILDYILKIDEINDSCNKIFNEYNDDDDIFKKNELLKNNNIWDELENLVYTLHIIFTDNPINKTHSDLLNLDEHIKWITNMNLIRTSNSNFNIDQFNIDCTNRINQINSICHDINNQINEPKCNLINNIIPNNSNSSDNIGTSILDILRKNQENDINRLINI